jgi:hypothetical protein
VGNALLAYSDGRFGISVKFWSGSYDSHNLGFIIPITQPVGCKHTVYQTEMVSEWFGVDMIGPSMSLTDELETTTRILLSMYAHVASTNHNIT